MGSLAGIVTLVIEAIVKFMGFEASRQSGADRQEAKKDGATAAENETLIVITETSDAQAQNNVRPRDPDGVAQRLRDSAAAASRTGPADAGGKPAQPKG